MHQVRRESQAALEQAKLATRFANEQGFPFWLALATMIRGGELTKQGNDQEGSMLIRQGLDAYRALGANIGNTYWVGLLAEKLGKMGQAAEGLTVLAEAFALVERNGERWWEAELYRMKGELTLQQANQKAKSKRQKVKIETNPQPLTPSPQSEAEACFLKALDIARQQHAKSLELRAAISLVRLRQQQATQYAVRNTQHVSHITLADTHKMLSDIYNWFTEGFETPDLQDAKALLQGFSGGLNQHEQSGLSF
jgi:predicted ATPase